MQLTNGVTSTKSQKRFCNNFLQQVSSFAVVASSAVAKKECGNLLLLHTRVCLAHLVTKTEISNSWVWNRRHWQRFRYFPLSLVRSIGCWFPPLHYWLSPIERGQFRFFRFCMKISLSNSMIFSRSPLLKTRQKC